MRVITYRAAYAAHDLSLCEDCAASSHPLGYALGPVQHGAHEGDCDGCRARRLARQLIQDDLSRVDEGVPLERDGQLAAAGWVAAASQAGDSDTADAILDAGGQEALAWAWGIEIDRVAPRRCVKCGAPLTDPRGIPDERCEACADPE